LRDDPASGVYKLVAIKIPTSPPTRNTRVDDMILYKYKTSPAKRTYLGPKQIYRILESKTLENEEQPPNSLPLLQKILDKGSLSKMPSAEESRSFHVDQLKTLPAKFLDLDFMPKSFAVFYSKQLENSSSTYIPSNQ
jgi:hypothetical protein